MTTQDIVTLTPSLPNNASLEEKEAFYEAGYALYRQNKYGQARPFFEVLSLYEPTTVKYRVALATCQKMAQEYDQAISNYAMAFMLEQNLALILHLVECQIEAYHLQNALDILAQLSAVKMPLFLQEIVLELQARAVALKTKH
jgi:tetratricopeptide (TPR) repeat protein